MTQSTPAIVYVSALTYRRPEMLGKLLEAFLALERPAGWELRFLIVDNDAGGGAKETVAAFEERFGGRLDYAVEPEPGIPFARNRALDGATAGGARLLAFIDDDSYPDPGWLSALIAGWEGSGAALINGPRRLVLNETPAGWWQGEIAKALIAHAAFVERFSARQARKGIVATGGTYNWLGDLDWIREKGLRFDTALRFSGGSDTAFREAVQRAGGKVAWCEKAIIYEYLPLERCALGLQFHRAVARGINAAKVGRRAPFAILRNPFGRIAVGAALILVPVLGRASFALGLTMLGMGIGALRARGKATSTLYARET